MAVIRAVHHGNSCGTWIRASLAYRRAAAAMLACSTCSRTSLASSSRMLSSVSR